MNTPRERPHVVFVVVLLTFVLTIAGGGAAMAYWTASTHLTAATTTAATGLSQSVGPHKDGTLLDWTYDVTTLVAADTVTLTNSGTREAEYRVSVSARRASAPALPAAITVSAAPVGSPADCSAESVLASPDTGTAESFLSAGTIDRGATVVLCIQTSMAAGDLSGHATQSADLSLSSSLVYAAGAAWTETADDVHFTQAVKAKSSGVPDSFAAAARHIVRNQGACVFRNTDVIREVTPSSCLGQEHAWRFTASEGGTFTITLAQNGSSPTSPRLTATTAGGFVTTQNVAGTSSQRWFVEGLAAGYQIRSAQHPDECLTVSSTRIWGSSGPFRLALAPCVGAPEQAFGVEEVGTAVPPVQQLSCTGNAWYQELSFPVNPEYQAETAYRVMLAHQNRPGSLFPYTRSTPTGWNTVVQFWSDSTEIATYVDASEGGYGNTKIYVEQQIAGVGDWRPVAEGDIHISSNGSGRQLSCGWQ